MTSTPIHSKCVLHASVEVSPIGAECNFVIADTRFIELFHKKLCMQMKKEKKIQLQLMLIYFIADFIDLGLLCI